MKSYQIKIYFSDKQEEKFNEIISKLNELPNYNNLSKSQLLYIFYPRFQDKFLDLLESLYNNTIK